MACNSFDFGFRLAALMRIGTTQTSTYAMYQAVAQLQRTMCSTLTPTSTLRAVGFVPSCRFYKTCDMQTYPLREVI